MAGVQAQCAQQRYEAYVGRSLDLPVGIMLGDGGYSKEDFLSTLLSAFVAVPGLGFPMPESPFIPSPMKYREILSEIGSPEIKALLDNFGQNWSEITLMQFLEQPQISAQFVHQLIWHEVDNAE